VGRGSSGSQYILLVLRCEIVNQLRLRTSSTFLRWSITVFGALLVVSIGLFVGWGRGLTAVLATGALLVLVALLTAPQWVIFAGGVLVFFGGYPIAGIPLSEIGLALIIAASIASQRPSWRLPTSLLLTSFLLVIWVAFVAFSDIGDPLVAKRLTSLVLWTVAILVLALPGATRLWTARGLLVGVLVSVPGSILLGSAYGNRWAGFMADPNAFAMTVALTVPLISYTLPERNWKIMAWSVGTALIVLADSRTGMLAIATAASVYVLAPRIRYWALGVPALMLFLSSLLPEDIVRGGRWEERLGSDELRERIEAAAQRQIDDNPLTGRGLGTGSVDLSVYGDPPQNAVFFLHNSYTSIVTEIGIVGLLTYALLVAGAVIAGLRTPVARGAIAAIAGAAAMSTQLGEVLFAVPMALALGYAWGDQDVEFSDGSGTSPQASIAPMRVPVGVGQRKLVELGSQADL
jgi:O-antigen ligase